MTGTCSIANQSITLEMDKIKIKKKMVSFFVSVSKWKEEAKGEEKKRCERMEYEENALKLKLIQRMTKREIMKRATV